MSIFSTETYIGRRKKLAKDVASGLILLFGNDELGMNFKDNVYHFRQDSSFLYFFGIDAPGLAGIIDIDQDEEIIFGDELSIDDVVWTGPQETIKEKAHKIGVKKTHAFHKIQEKLQKAQSKGREIHFLPPYRSDNAIKLYQLLGLNPSELKNKASVKLIKAIVAQREIKSEEEVNEIEKAVRTTNKMHLRAMEFARPGIWERDVVAEVEGIATSGGGTTSFPVIMTVNGETLHNHYHGNRLQVGDMLLCDCGAETAAGYAGDMTRTFPVGNRFSQKQAEVYDIVSRSHYAAVDQLKAGVRFLDVHLHACTVLAEGLKDLGIMQGNIADAVHQGAHAMFFQCGLGHMMGLDVHDMEDLGEQYVGYTDSLKKSSQFGLKSLRLGKELEAGHVITVEPGAYFIPTLIDQWKAAGKFKEFINYNVLEQYRDFGGIRVEEDFLVTKDGYQLLGEAIPLHRQDVESVRKAQNILV